MGSFKYLFVSIILIMALIAASINAAAVQKVVKVDRISAVQDDAETVVVVGLKSQQKLTDSKVTVSIPDLGLRVRHNVDFDKSSKQTVNLVLPGQSLDDQYIRVVFNSDQGRRVRYMQAVIE